MSHSCACRDIMSCHTHTHTLINNYLCWSTPTQSGHLRYINLAVAHLKLPKRDKLPSKEPCIFAQRDINSNTDDWNRMIINYINKKWRRDKKRQIHLPPPDLTPGKDIAVFRQLMASCKSPCFFSIRAFINMYIGCSRT